MKVTLDANILVYAANPKDGAKHVAAAELLKRAALSDAVLVLQAVAEAFHVLTRKRVSSPHDAQLYVRGLVRAFRVVAADSDSLELAIGATHQHGLAFWDAMLWASAERAGCDLLVTEDMQAGRRLGSVRIVNPFPQLPREVDDALTPL